MAITFIWLLVGFEIISRILYTTEGNWQEQVTVVLNIVNEFFDVSALLSCATHIHIRPEDGYALQDLKSIAKITAFFDEDICIFCPKRGGTAFRTITTIPMPIRN